MKRKMGFGFAPLKLISRSNKSKPAEDAVLDVEDDLDFPLDSSFINRPPPLDPKTERELWKACAVILQNLKPSGWDIEDTRMRSDMLVEDDEDDEHEQQKTAPRLDPPMPTKGPRSKPLVMHAVQSGKADNARPPSGMEPIKTEAAQVRYAGGRAESGSGLIPLQDFESPRLDFLPQLHQLAALESPTLLSQAPPGLTRDFNTRQGTAEEGNRPPAAQRVDSSSTLSSSRYSRSNSTNEINTTSTGFTSAAYTPDVSSKRVSEQAHSEPPNANRSTAGAGHWMKEEVEKRRQTETTHAIHESTKPAAAGPSHPLISTASDSQDVRTPQTHSRTATPDVRYRDSQSSFSRPRSNGAPRERRRLDDSPGAGAASSNAAESNKSAIMESLDFQDQSVSRSPNARGDPQLDRPQTPQRSKESVPPVPALPASRTLPDNEQQQPPFRASERPNISKPRHAEGNDFGVQFVQDSEIRTADLPSTARTRLSPTSPSFPPISLRPLSDASSDSRASQKSRHTSRDSTVQKYQLIPLKHHDDESIVVKDFWKPHIRRRGTKPRNVPAVDIQAADFDDLMSFMKDNKEAFAAMSRDAVSSCNTSLVNSYADSVINEQQNLQTQQPIPPTVAASQGSTDRTRSLSSLQHYESNRPAYNAAFSSQSSFHNGLVSPASISPSLHFKPADSNQPRGIKRVLNRLAGGDTPRQRNVYIPPAGPRYSEAEEDDWYDSQACAAPVVGFGRGW